MRQKKEEVKKTKMNPSEEDAKNLEKEFGAIKNVPVQEQTRTVKLYQHSVGGWIERTVPFNSNFQDGDIISDSNCHDSDRDIPGNFSRKRDAREYDWGHHSEGL